MKSYITTYKAIFGWKAVLIEWTFTKGGGYWEPSSTGIGFYDTREEAEAEAMDWASSEGLEFRSSESKNDNKKKL